MEQSWESEIGSVYDQLRYQLDLECAGWMVALGEGKKRTGAPFSTKASLAAPELEPKGRGTDDIRVGVVRATE